MLMTGDEYRESLRDGRATFFEGQAVPDVTADPILGRAVDAVAKSYDRWYDPAPDARSPLMAVPTSAEELNERVPLLHEAGMMAHVTYTSIMTLITASGRLDKLDPVYQRRLHDYVEQVQDRDLRVTQCITDAKGDRSRPPAHQDDPDAYTHVVERRSDGVVIRGAKLHITGASLAACGETQTLLSAGICGSCCVRIAGGDADHR